MVCKSSPERWESFILTRHKNFLGGARESISEGTRKGPDSISH